MVWLFGCLVLAAEASRRAERFSCLVVWFLPAASVTVCRAVWLFGCLVVWFLPTAARPLVALLAKKRHCVPSGLVV